jgi:cell shape-determining protein MreC
MIAMSVRSRRYLMGAALLTATLLAAAGGLVGSVWSTLDLAVRPWQQGLTGSNEASIESLALREQVLHLNAENTLLRARLADYTAIRGEGGLNPAQAVVARARIVGRTIRAGRRFLELDAGALDGVAKGMPVCCGWSLVGIVTGLQAGRCLVQQVTDSESRVPAAILNGGAVLAEGVFTGTGKRGLAEMTLVEDRPGLAITAGMLVVTVGTDERIPSGLVLGTVSEANRSTTADQWQVTVTPQRTGDASESVLVLGFVRQSR